MKFPKEITFETILRNTSSVLGMKLNENIKADLESAFARQELGNHQIANKIDTIEAKFPNLTFMFWSEFLKKCGCDQTTIKSICSKLVTNSIISDRPRGITFPLGNGPMFR
jgi:hypothetical protein